MDDKVFGGSLFELGRVVATQGAVDEMASLFGSIIGHLEIGRLVTRHNTGDWGNIDPADRGLNEKALKDEARIFSVYHVIGVRFWVITEADRSYTTVLLPSEY